jgi:hypothetical protein
MLWFLWMVLVGVIAVLPFWKICQKAGFTPVLSLLMLIPFINLITIYYIAFTEWPALKGKQPPQA